MGKRSVSWILIAVGVFVCWSAKTNGAQERGGVQGQAPNLMPDLSGVWYAPPPGDAIHHSKVTKGRPQTTPPKEVFQPWAETAFETNVAALKARILRITQHPDTINDDLNVRCLPEGLPRVMLETSYPFEIVQSRDRVIMIFEHENRSVREIFMNRSEHPKDLDPTYMGNSIGRYEGDTLIVDTVGFTDKSWINSNGVPHSDALHILERIRRVDKNNLEDHMTIDDPKAFTKQWVIDLSFELTPGWDVQEFVCLDNNRPY